MNRIIRTLSLLLITVVTATAIASAKDAYQPMGATSTPKVEARWNFYRDYSQATELLHELADAFPHLMKLESLGQSWEGREMWGLTITNQASGDEAAKPGFWIDGGIHAGRAG